MKKKFGIKAKTLILIAGSAVVFYATVTTIGGNFLKNSFLETKASHLINIRDMQAIRIAEYLQELKSQISLLSATPFVVNASEEFIGAFDDVLSTTVDFKTKDKLLLHYKAFADSIHAATGKSVSPDDFLPENGERAILQAKYVFNESIDPDQSRAIDKYVQVHDKYHQFFKKVLNTCQYYDIFVIDRRTGNIVYSVEKETDFATNLYKGPFQNSNLASLIKEITKQSSTGEPQPEIADFSNYLPSYNSPASFISYPIYSNGESFAYIVAQVSVFRINEIMLFQKRWQQLGLGLTGETYLYGNDNLLRSDRREFVEEVDSLEPINHGDHSIMTQKPKTVIQESIGNPANQVSVTKDGDKLKLSAHKELGGGDLDWNIMAEMELKEILLPLEGLQSKAFIMIFIVIYIFTIVLIAITTIFVNRILHLNKQAEEISNGNLEVRAEINSRDEMGNLAKTFNRMVDALKDERFQNQKKQQELEQANNKLEETYSQLLISEKMASIGELLAGIAHEINNPLNYIYNGTSSLKEIATNVSDCLNQCDIKENDSVDQCNKNIKWLHKMIETIETGTERVMEIIGSLLVFGREKQGELCEIEIVKTLNMALVLFENKTKYTINVLKQFNEVPNVVGNPGKLNQVFVNLISNAIQAIEEKYGEEVKREKEGVLLLSTRIHKNKKHVIVSIGDNGPGIPDNIKKKIFDPFFTTKETGKGTGLGLSITYSIIEAHNGTIKVCQEAENINGATQSMTKFEIYLPIERIEVETTPS